MKQTIKEIYDSPFGEAFILPKGYDSSFKKTSIDDAKKYTDGSKVHLYGVVSNFRIKTTGKFANIFADLKFGESKIMLQWPSSVEKSSFKKIKLEETYLGKNCNIYGSITSFGTNENRCTYISKIIQKESSEEENEDSGVLIPVYELKKQTKPYELSKAIKDAIVYADKDILSMPNNVEKNLNLPSLKESLEIVHCLVKTNINQEDMLQQKTIFHKRIKMELLWRTLIMLDEDNLEEPSFLINYKKEDMLDLEEFLNVKLTNEQKIAIGKVFKIFQGQKFKRTLLQGDVGSGKTFVSIFTSYAVIKNGFQVAVIAPSSILAKQLFEEYEKSLGKKGIKVFFANSSSTKKEKQKIQTEISSGDPCVVIGTTTINSFDFKNLALVIVDEEQKFGVAAKDALIHKESEFKPYQILMSATPIPRSLASAMFGNVEVATIKAKPEGREPVKTKIITDHSESIKLFEFIKSEAIQGRKALAVVPSIDSEDMASGEKVLTMCQDYFGNDFVKLINGKMSEKEIVSVVDDFKSSKINFLIATSMVDAGFSDPSISTVIIFDPDRFGLSQLHQIRGRGGRSSGLKSYCALYPLNFELKDKALDRLTFFSKNLDGFLLANEDLKFRGSGNLVGNKQSGGGDVDFIENFEDVLLLKEELRKVKNYM